MAPAPGPRGRPQALPRPRGRRRDASRLRPRAGGPPIAGPFETGGIRWWPATGAPAAALGEAVAAALEALRGGAARNLKAGRRKELYALAARPGAEPSFLLKVNRYEAGAAWRRRAFGSKARRELRLAERVAALGIPTPLPLAAGERREGVRVTTCYLLTPFLAGARDLRRALAEPLAAHERRALARAFGAFVRRLHDAGIDQEDLQPNNFLLGTAGPRDLYLIDFERLALRRRIATRERELRLAKLVRELPAARRSDRARFLLAYLVDDRSAFAGAWRGVAGAGARLARRDALRLRRVVAEGGRRFRAFEVAGWRGVRAGEQEAQALEASFTPLLRANIDEVTDPYAVLAAHPHFAVALPAASRRASLATFANAVLLARRGLAPAPAAILQRGDRALLVFEGPLPRHLQVASLAERRAALPALTLLLESLAALGELDAPRAELIAFAPQGAPLALQLLAPEGLRLTGRPAPGGIAARRALAAQLLGVADAGRAAVQRDRR